MASHQLTVLQLVFSLDFGGLEKTVISLSEKLKGDGYESVICCLDKDGEMAQEARSRGLKVLSADRRNGFDIALAFKLANIIKEETIDVVHTHNMGPMLYGTLGADLARVPAVHTKHDRQNKTVNKLAWSAISWRNRSIVTISEDSRREFLRQAFVDPNKVKVIHNGIDTVPFIRPVDVSRAKATLGIGQNETVMGTVARLSLEKDHHTLLGAFSIVRRRIPEAKLLMVGDGPMRRGLEEHAAGLRLGASVVFLGNRTDIAEVLSVMDIFLLTSLTEGISVSLLEAMASGRPVIATAVGGNPEIITDGVDGVLVPPKDPERTSNAALSLLLNRERSQRMGIAARARVEGKFGLNHMVEQYEELYRTVHKRRRPMETNDA